MRYILIFLFLPTILYADPGVNISCVNMKNLLDKNYKIHRFYFDVTTFQYFDEKKNDFIQVYRVGYFRCDKTFASGDDCLEMFLIPDGKQKAMSTLGTNKLKHR